MPHLLRLPLLLLALSLPVTTSYGRVYSLSPHLGDVGGGMRVNLTGRGFVDYGDVRCRFGTIGEIDTLGGPVLGGTWVRLSGRNFADLRRQSGELPTAEEMPRPSDRRLPTLHLL